MTFCKIHRNHSPQPLSAESHHLIPRAWQALWHPDGHPHTHTVMPMIWAPETIDLCPTGHRAVHEILVRIMRAYAPMNRNTALHPRLESARRIASRDFGRRAEFPVAMDAVRLWTEHGGSLDLLVDRRRYGESIAERMFLVP